MQTEVQVELVVNQEKGLLHTYVDSTLIWFVGKIKLVPLGRNFNFQKSLMLDINYIRQSLMNSANLALY